MTTLSLTLPSERRRSRYLEHCRTRSFSYPEVGATRGKLPSGYFIDRNRICLGRGPEVYQRACEAVRSWRHYPTSWVRRFPDQVPLRAGETVVVCARAWGLWATVACRIVYVIETEDGSREFGFAYGTLADHIAQGEERFLVQWDADGRVWYEVLAFSRPRPLWARCGLPVIRRVQKKFASQSLLAMKSAVSRDE